MLLHAQKLREFGVSVTDVVNALRMQNANAPVGKVRGELEDQSIRLVGRFETPAEFNEMLIKRRGDNLIRLGQVATVQDGFAEMDGYNERNNKLNVGISVTRTRDASTVSVAKGVRDLVETINKEQGGKSRLEITQDGGEDAQDSLDNVIHALFFGAGLTVLVVYVFLNSWRSTLITGLSLPTSVITAFIAVWLCGFTLNFMSLLGLSLAIGVLIDDAIVVRENIVRHMQRGEDRRTAALNGTAEIGMAVAATTFSIVAVFAPVAFIPGMTGEWFRPFGLTVVASVVVSLFISFTLDPMLSAYWGDPVDMHDKPRTGISRYLQRFNDWFDAPGRPLQPHHRMGAAPPLVHGLGRLPQLRAGDRAAGDARRLRLPAQVRQRHAGSGRAHAAQQQPGLRPHEGGRGRGARAHAARDGGHQQHASIRAAAASTSTSARARSASATRLPSATTCASRWRASSAPSTSCSTT